jgi:hypothetical protein
VLDRGVWFRILDGQIGRDIIDGGGRLGVLGLRVFGAGVSRFGIRRGLFRHIVGYVDAFGVRGCCVVAAVARARARVGGEGAAEAGWRLGATCGLTN